MTPILFRPFTGNGNYPVWFTLDTRYSALLKSWRSAFPGAVASNNCVPPDQQEEFIENAVRLDAALRSGHPVAIVGEDNIARQGSSRGEPLPDGTTCHYIGLFVNSDTPLAGNGEMRTGGGIFGRYNIISTGQNADGYAKTATFQRFAGRPVSLCGIDVAPGQADVLDEIVRMRERGWTDFFIKVNRSKYGVYELSVTKDMSRDAISGALLDVMEFAVPHLEGQPNALILQGRVKMNYEYRMTIINHVPVAGAGCVEAFTPLNNSDCLFDNQMEALRNNQQVERKYDLLDRYISFATRVGQEFKAECPDMKHYSLDICMIDGMPAVIELNQFANLGLYATKYDAVLTALLRDQPKPTSAPVKAMRC